MSVHVYRGTWPTLHPTVYVAPSAAVIGDVHVGEASSVWFGAVLRGDKMPIRIGARTSIQDNSVVHITGGRSSVAIGDDCTVGHAVILHGCCVADRVLVGMGSILLDDVEIASDVVIGAGTLLTPRTRIPSGVLVVGRPGKVVRGLRDDERAELLEASRHYVELARDYGASS